MSIKTKPGGNRPRRRAAVVGGIVGGILLLAAAAYVGGYFIAGDNLPTNTEIGGVRVGGLDRTAAIEKLKTELGPKANPQMTLTAGDQKITKSAAEWGLVPDYEASVDAAKPSRSWEPARIWFSLTGGGKFDLVPNADDQATKSAVSVLAATIDRQPKDATIQYATGKVVTAPGKQGLTLDQAATVSALRDAYLKSTDVEGKSSLNDPDITDEEISTFKSEWADPAVSGPITVKVGQRSLTIAPLTIARSIKLSTADSKPKGELDAGALLKAMQPQITSLQLTQAKDARFTFTNGRPTLVPSSDGVELTPDALGKAVNSVLLEKSNRTATADVSGKKPRVTTEAAQQLGIKEVIGEFTTYFPGDAYRFTNLGLAAKGINGSLLLPGDTFSLNGTLGERTRAKGYVEGSYIDGSTLRRVVGGGISQSATTTFNAIFFAGLKDVEHHPHTLYFTRYPAGREATVAWGSLDLKFQNDTKHGVLMQAYTTRLGNGSGSITVKVWSTKTYSAVKSSELRRSGYYYGTTRYDTSNNCVGQGATPGFTVNYDRLFYQNGRLVKTEPFKWTYDAGDRVICGPKPADKPAGTPR